MTTSVSPTPIVPGRWRKLSLISAGLWADNNEGSILGTLAPVIIAALALPLSALGLLNAIGKATSIVFGPIWAWIARRTNRKTTFVIAVALTGVSTAANGLSQDYGQIIAFYALSSIFISAALPIVTEIATDLFDEQSRGRASGYTWGAISILGAVGGPLIGQLANVPDGWRYGFFGWGALTLVVSLVIAVFFQDPGVGASEPTTALISAQTRRENERLTRAKLKSLFRIPTFTLMLVQRLLSGHLLIAGFGITFLVQQYHFATATAAIVSLPNGIGFIVGALAGGFVTDKLQARDPRRGRVIVLQSAQFLFAVAAILGTQFDYESIGVYAVFWALMGLFQGVNPGVNRPIVAAVTPPELRGAAFALMLSVFEALAYVIFNLAAGYLGEWIGLGVVMLLIPGALMLVNGVYCTLLYRTYPRDVAALDQQLRSRAS
ncbi:MFS transporter [Kutzneria sp. NPDC052558]|uniref:MFS transporter n=1 Tax=Kutzneria sp. NPDC052558 TaxID=3364121 RepID=UPI0037CC2020